MWLVVARVVSAVFLLIAAARPSSGQESVNSGSVSGRVTDASGAAITGAEVKIRHTQTDVTGAAVSDPEGRFRFSYLRVGPYEITVTRTGFADAARRLDLSPGAAFELPVVLSVRSVETAVLVTAETAVIDAARSQIAGTVANTEVQSLPMNGRNFLDIALLIPGVSPTNVGGGTQVFAETSAVPGVGLSVGSQRNLSNSFIVDGLSANDDAAGLSGITYGVDAVEQFQVVTSGGQAELGRALGGYVNVVTRSGTNTRQGTSYFFLRDDGLNAKNALTGARLPMSQSQFGASLGGPLVSGKTFYFSNVEQKRLDSTGVVTAAQSAVDAINARLASVGYQGPAVSTGLYKNPIHTTNLVAKVDHHVSNSSHMSVRYSLYDLYAENARGAGGLNTPSASSFVDTFDQTVAVSNVRTLASNTVNETRAQFALSGLGAEPTESLGPTVNIAGVATFGRFGSSPTGRDTKMVQLVNSLSHIRGAHVFRAGVDFLYNDVTITFPRSIRGSYAFSSLTNFLSGTYSNSGFSQTFGETTIPQTNSNVGVYVQDEWKLGQRFTLNGGLRYDLQFLETISPDVNNLSPRAGFAWVPSASRRTVLRGSAGLFYDRVPLRALANALLSAGNTTDLGNLKQVNVSLSPTQSGAPVFPNVLPAFVPTTTLVNLTTMDRDLENAFSRQGSLEVEHLLGGTMTASVGYSYTGGRQLLMAINQNVPSCVAAGTNNGCRPISTYANNSQYSSAGTSNYHALHVSVVQRPVAWGHYRVSYALSKSMNNVGEFFFSGPIDPFDLSKDWARSDDDQRHRLVLAGSLSTPAGPAETAWQRLTHGFQLSGMLQAYSALPYNITSGVTTVQGTTGRPIVDGQFLGRNTGVGSDFFTMSLRLNRTFTLAPGLQIEGLIEGFNVTNRRNDVARNANFGSGAYPTSPSATFGQITAVGEPRTLQVGVRVRF